MGSDVQVGDRVRFWCYCPERHESHGVVVDINGAGHYGIGLSGGSYAIRPPHEVELIERATTAPALDTLQRALGAMDRAVELAERFNGVTITTEALEAIRQAVHALAEMGVAQ